MTVPVPPGWVQLSDNEAVAGSAILGVRIEEPTVTDGNLYPQIGRYQVVVDLAGGTSSASDTWIYPHADYAAEWPPRPATAAWFRLSGVYAPDESHARNLAHAAFVNLLTRIAEAVSPSATCPVTGDVCAEDCSYRCRRL